MKWSSMNHAGTVSYTHLDVYKRQEEIWLFKRLRSGAGVRQAVFFFEKYGLQRNGVNDRMQIGKASIKFEEPPVIESMASIVGKKEGEGPLGKLFDVVEQDDMFGADTWEQAESCILYTSRCV